MPLSDKIDQDLKQSMLAQNVVCLSTLRFLKSALKYSAIEKKVESLTDAEVQQIIQKQVKQHRESVDQFAKAGRNELAQKEMAEIAILESYLPKQLSVEALEEVVTRILEENQPASKKDFGRLMKILNEKLAGSADSKRVSEILGSRLK